MKCEVSKKFTFDAAHSLPFLPDGHKCKRTHGHTYTVKLTFAGEHPDNGMLIDFAEISSVVKPIVEKCDHQNLNDVIPFSTTSENIALWFYQQVKRRIKILRSVEVSETNATSAKVEE